MKSPSTMMKYIFILLSVCVTALPVVSAELPIKAAIFHLAPWASSNNSKPVGIVPDILHALESEFGAPIKQSLVPYPRMLRQIETGEADIAIFFLSEKSRTIADPLTVFYLLKTSVIINGPIPTNSKRTGKLKIATARGVLFDSRFDNSRIYERVITNDNQHSIRLLLSNRVHGIAGPEVQLLREIQAIDPNGDYNVLEILNSNQVTLQFSKASKNSSKAEALKQAALAIRNNGKLEEILSRHNYKPSRFSEPKLPAEK